MPWSITIARVAGSEIRIHLTFFLLLAFVGLEDYQQGGAAAALRGIVLVLAVFACVVLHEFGHALAARRYGIKTPDITVLPIGGLARLSRMPEKPSEEIVIAIAGPLVNVVIAGVLFAVLGAYSDGGAMRHIGDPNYNLLAQVAGSNVVLVLFNLIPAFPMDGGRVLRSLFALKMDYIRATSLEAGIGQALAVFFIFWGIFSNFWLVLIGIFLYLGAGSEKQQVILQTLLASVPVSQAMTTEFISLKPDDSVVTALEHFHHGSQQDFPVVGDFGIEGILTRDKILASIHSKGLNVPVMEVMDKSFATVDPKMGLDEVYKILLSGNKTAVVVVDAGEIKGIISLDGISRYFMIRAALKNVTSEDFIAQMKKA
jgi:Zn-dependent protease/predicted transcriptional regulator